MYRAYKDECGKTGNKTPKKKPAFFDEVNEFLSGKPCAKPKVVINSSQIVIEDGTEGSEESKGSVENVVPSLLPTAATTTTTKPANAKNQKRMLV